MVGTFSVLVKWLGVGDGFIWACSGVYGPNENIERGYMWDELVGIQQNWRLPWCCFGDFLVLMKIKMISWNVRGLNDSRKRLVVKNSLREWKCDVVCLQETKIASMNRQLVCSLWSCPYVDWAVLEADRTVGGILLMWDKRVLEKVEVMVGTFSVLVKWHGVGDNFI